MKQFLRTRIATIGYVFLTLAMQGLSTLDAFAFDLTGTWEGKVRCSVRDGGRFNFVDDALDLLILQDGTGKNLSVRFIAKGDQLQTPQSAQFTGGAEPRTHRPDREGDVGFVECSPPTETGDFVSEVWGGSVRVSPNTGAATLRLKRNRVDSVLNAGVRVQECTATYKRIDTAAPPINECR